MKCSKESCTLFVPEEKYLNLMDAYESKVLEKHKPSNFPKCDCNELASLWLSYSSKNPNQPYFRCQDTDPEEMQLFPVDLFLSYLQLANSVRQDRKTDLTNAQVLMH